MTRILRNQQPRDVLDREITVGDFIIYATSMSSSVYMHLGEVTEVERWDDTFGWSAMKTKGTKPDDWDHEVRLIITNWPFQAKAFEPSKYGPTYGESTKRITKFERVIKVEAPEHVLVEKERRGV